MDINLIIVTAYSYFLGSIPFGLVLTKIFLKKDIRDVGSGNIGATNTLRAGNKLSAAMATDIANMKIGIHQHKRAMGDSHQQVENVIVDETSKAMNFMTNEFQRQLKESNEALKAYFETLVASPELICKLMEVLEKNSNRITYGETLEEVEEKDEL